MDNVDIAFMLVQAAREDADFRRLIRLCESGESSVLQTIAKRATLPESVKLALIIHGDDAVLDIVQEHDLTQLAIVALALRNRWSPAWADAIDNELILLWLCNRMDEYDRYIRSNKFLSPEFKLLDMISQEFWIEPNHLELILNDERIADDIKFLAEDQNPFN